MPATARTASAHAACDVKLSRHLSSIGYVVSPARIARWRGFGLLPAPRSFEEPIARRRGGRIAQSWDDEAWVTSVELGVALAKRSVSGRALARVAMELFLEGLPVPVATVRNCALIFIDAMTASIEKEVAKAVTRFPPPTEDPLEPEWEEALALAQATTLPRTHAQRVSAQPSSDGPDAVSALVLVTMVMRGGQPEASEEEAEALLQLFGAHGILEAAGPATPAMLNSGQEILPALHAASLPALTSSLREMPDERIVQAREAMSTLSRAFEALPRETVHFLGLPPGTQLWSPAEPAFASLLIGLFGILHRNLGDAVFDNIGEIATAAGINS